MPGPSADGAGGAWGGGGWADINIHIDINTNIDNHIIINMNRPQAPLRHSAFCLDMCPWTNKHVCVIVFYQSWWIFIRYSSIVVDMLCICDLVGACITSLVVGSATCSARVAFEVSEICRVVLCTDSVHAYSYSCDLVFSEGRSLN